MSVPEPTPPNMLAVLCTIVGWKPARCEGRKQGDAHENRFLHADAGRTGTSKSMTSTTGAGDDASRTSRSCSITSSRAGFAPLAYRRGIGKTNKGHQTLPALHAESGNWHLEMHRDAHQRLENGVRQDGRCEGGRWLSWSNTRRLHSPLINSTSIPLPLLFILLSSPPAHPGWNSLRRPPDFATLGGMGFLFPGDARTLRLLVSSTFPRNVLALPLSSSPAALLCCRPI